MPRGARLAQCRSSDIAEHAAAEREGKTARAIILQQSNQGKAGLRLALRERETGRGDERQWWVNNYSEDE